VRTVFVGCYAALEFAGLDGSGDDIVVDRPEDEDA
jgi:hypothetical protein